jgi:hypothetical protein
MTNEPNGPEERHWLLEPPASQEIQFQIEAGSRVVITPEVQAAFEHLVRTLLGSDVQGFVYDPKCTERYLTCVPNLKCDVESQKPCLIDYHCRIASIS